MVVIIVMSVGMSLRVAHEAVPDLHGTFRDVVVRGGGFVTGLEVQGPSMYARTDVGGAYRYDVAHDRWEQMISADSVNGELDSNDYHVEALGAAPSSPSVVYVSVGATSDSAPGGRLLRSQDAGRHWTVLPPTDWYVGGNDEWRQSGARLAVDPLDPRTVYVGTRRDGLFLSRNGGETWQTLLEPPPERSDSDLFNIGVTSVVIDRSSPVVDGRHVGLWLGVAGIGLMRSLDGGTSWQNVSSFPDGFVSDVAIDAHNTIFAAFYGVGESTRSSIRKIDSSGEVTDISPSIDGKWLTVALNPNVPGQMLAASDSVRKGMGLIVTSDAYADNPVWQAAPSRIAAGVDGTVWPVVSDVFDYMSTGQIRFFGGVAWFAEGMGTWRAEPSLDSSLVWQFASTGIEELVANAIFKPRRSALLTAQWDRGLMRHPNPTDERPTPSEAAAFPYRTQFGSAWDINGSPTNPNFLVAVVDDHQDLTGRTSPERRASAYSEDGGSTWHRFASLVRGTAPPDMYFGNIAVSAYDDANIVWVPSNLSGLATKIYASRDGGASWVSADVKGLTQDQYLHRSYVQARRILVASPTVRGMFFALGSDASGAALIWRSMDGGVSWSLQWKSRPADEGGNGFRYDSTLVAAGPYLIAAPGPGGGCSYRSGDDGSTWEELCSLSGALGMGVGAPTHDSRTDAILYSYGTAGGRAGMYRSVDYGLHWHLLAADPSGLYMGIRAVAGDPDQSGRVYVGLNGGGFQVGQF